MPHSGEPAAHSPVWMCTDLNPRLRNGRVKEVLVHFNERSVGVIALWEARRNRRILAIFCTKRSGLSKREIEAVIELGRLSPGKGLCADTSGGGLRSHGMSKSAQKAGIGSPVDDEARAWLHGGSSFLAADIKRSSSCGCCAG
jgi:hypothetical protein